MAIKTKEKTFELKTKNVGALLLKYSIPSVISMLVIALYNIVDRIYIGHSLGALAISGLALTLPISSLVTAVGTLVGVGASSRISIVLGKNDTQWARNILCHYVILTIIISSIFSILAYIYLDEILMRFGATEQTLPYAKSYLKIIIPASILTNLCFGLSHILRAAGFPNKSMRAILIGVLLNMILDPIFLYAFDTGIEGVAIATAISMAVGAFYSVLHFTNKSNTISFHWHKFKFRFYIVKNIISIGFSPFLMNAVASGVVMVLNLQLAKHGGDYAIGAFGIIYSYQLFLALLIMGITYAMQPIVGYNYGANNYKRVKNTLFLTMKVSTLCTIPFFITAEFFPEFLSRAFTSDAELIRQSAVGFRASFLGSPFIGIPITISIFFLSIGRATKSFLMSMLRQVIILTPLIILLPQIWGIKGIWYALSISDIIAFIVSSIFLIYELKRLYKIPKNKPISLYKIWRPF